ncbi:MAG: LamG domain-containing protein, partial [Bacteroidetes bacterium]
TAVNSDIFVSKLSLPEINLQGNAQNIADGDASSTTADHTDFGVTGISTPFVRTFTIQNTGTGRVYIASISNSNTTDFTVSGLSLPTTIGAGSSKTFTVTLNSATMGTKNATITVNNDDADEGAYDFAITGRVINATPDTKRGNMLTLDGLETLGFDHVSIPDNASLNIGTGQLTLAAWVKRDVAGTFDNIIMKGSYGYGLVIDDSDKLGYWSDFLYTNCFSAGNIPANVWTHVAVVVNAGVSTTLYINGVNVGVSGAGNAIINNNTGILAFGTQDIGSCDCNNHGGNIDEVQIWNVALTQAQIRENMHLTLSGSESGLVGYWQFNETSGNAIDAVNGNNGTLQNGASRIESSVSVAKGVATRLTAPVGASTQVFGNATVNFTAMTAPATDDEFVAYQMYDRPLNNMSATNTASNYWIVRQFGTQTFSYNQMSFTLPANNTISTTDETTPSNFKLFKRNHNSGGAWGTEIGTGSSANNTTKVVTYTISPAQTSFSEFGIASVTSPLPITLLGLKGYRVSGGQGNGFTDEVRLEWATASEINNKGFEVEMSDNGLAYEKIAFVEGKGNSLTSNIYQLTTIQPLSR